MPIEPVVVQKPQRWDSSFDPEMTDADVARLLAIPPFRDMKPAKFPKLLPLAGILRNDTRIRKYRQGEIVVRKGDYSTTAFMILAGSVRVVLDPDLPPGVLGRRVSRRRGLGRILAQVWAGLKEPETRRRSILQTDPRIGAREEEGGEVRIFLQDIPQVIQNFQTQLRQPGELFGEVAALSRLPRTFSIFAETDGTELLEIRWQGLRDLMKNDEALRRHVDQIYRERALEAALRAVPIFDHLSDAQIRLLMEQTEFQTYGEYDWSGDFKRQAKAGTAGRPDQEPVIAQEGDYPNGVVIIRSGFARLSQRFGQRHRTLSYLGGGTCYGLAEIAHNWRLPKETVPLQHTLRAVGYTHVLIVPTALMEEVVLPAMPTKLFPPIAEAAAASANTASRIGSGLLEFFAENRFFNGTAAMLIDLDQCTHCDDCVRACASTHNNNPRFVRHGPIHGPIMVAHACMHCADPVCMIGCPTGAIHRSTAGGEIVINQTTCIGCSICANNCPYDAIRMVEIRDDEGVFMVDKDLKPILKATKCDLCVDQYGGPACERACPHGALVRTDMSDMNTLAQWLDR